MQLNKRQLAKLDAWALDCANSRLVQWLKRRYPAQCSQLGDAELLAFVVAQRAQAASYEVKREDNVATFLDLAVMYGPGFPQQLWAADALASKLHGPDKMAILRARIENNDVMLSSNGEA